MADEAENSSPLLGDDLSFPLPEVSSETSSEEDLDMDTDSQSEDGLTSLSDSTFEIISHSSFHTSDEEAPEDGTESLISFGSPTPEGSSVDGDEYLAPQSPFQDDFQPPVAEIQQSYDSTEDDDLIRTSPSLECSSLEQSDLSTITNTTITNSAADWIKFKDPIRGVASGLIDVCRPSKLDALEDSQQPKRAVRMTLSNKRFQPNPSFRIMFYTCYPELVELKHSILEKLGQALFLSRVPRTGDQRSVMSIVPISASEHDGDEPDVVLVPSSGIQIHVDDRSKWMLKADECPKGKISFLAVRGCLVYYPQVNIPDLFVFVHPGPDHPLEQLKSSLIMSEKLKRRGIPVLDICDKQWTPDLLNESQNFPQGDVSSLIQFRPWRGRAVHVVHSVPNTNGQYAEYAMPIDSDAFQYVEAVDLNSNLGVITHKDSLGDRMWSVVRDKLKSDGFGPHLRYIILAGLLLTLLLGPILVASPEHAESLIWCPSCKHKAVPTSSSAKITSTPAQTEVVQRSLPPPIAPLLLSGPKLSAKTKALTRMASSHNPCTASKIHKSSSMREKSKNTPEFQILEADDGRLYLQASKNLPRKWKPSSNFVLAVQGDTPLETSFTPINDTTFELHLGESGSCKPVIVTVWPYPGQTASQTFQLSRPCPSTSSPQAVAGAALEIFGLVSRYMGSRTLNLFNYVEQHSLDFYSRNREYVMQQSVWHSHQLGSLSQRSLQRLHQLNKGIENARVTFNAQADEQINNIGQYMKTKVQQTSNGVKALGNDLGVFFINMKNRAGRGVDENIRAQTLLYQRARTKIETLRKGVHCGVDNQLPNFMCRSRLPRAAPIHIKRAKTRANFLKNRVARCGARFRARRE